MIHILDFIIKLIAFAILFIIITPILIILSLLLWKYYFIGLVDGMINNILK